MESGHGSGGADGTIPQREGQGSRGLLPTLLPYAGTGPGARDS